MRQLSDDFMDEIEQFFVVEQQHEEYAYFNLFALVYFVHDVLHFNLIAKVLFQLFPVVVRLLDFVLVVFLHAAFENFNESAEDDYKFFAFVFSLGEGKLVSEGSIAFVLFPGSFVEFDGTGHN